MSKVQWKDTKDVWSHMCKFWGFVALVIGPAALFGTPIVMFNVKRISFRDGSLIEDATMVEEDENKLKVACDG